MREEDEQCKTALQQCARSFVDGIIQLVSSEKEYYKFIIIACKENTNKIMELVFSWYFLLIPCKVIFLSILCAHSLDKERTICFLLYVVVNFLTDLLPFNNSIPSVFI